MQGPSYLGLTRSISLRRQDIRSHDIDYVDYVGAGLTWGRILSTCVISMWSNDKKCKYMFFFPLQNLARKEYRQFFRRDLAYTNRSTIYKHVHITTQMHLFAIAQAKHFRTYILVLSYRRTHKMYHLVRCTSHNRAVCHQYIDVCRTHATLTVFRSNHAYTVSIFHITSSFSRYILGG